MYDVTDTYKTLIKQPTRYVGIRGAVKLRSGEIVQFTEKNIVSGSLSITDRLNRRGDFRPGGVYSSGLSIGFTGLFARTNDLDGAVIRLNYFIYPNAEMKLSEAEVVPLGRFYVDGSTIKRNRSTVRLKADDALMLFDIPTTERSGTLYELVTGSCAAAGVSFGMTQAEFEALPNATLSAAINTARVQNERDLLMYVGMLTGSFARMNRAGLALEFRPLTCEKDSSTHVIIPAREIAGNIRFTTDFSDDTTRIAKLLMRRKGTPVYSTSTVTAGGSEKLATLELDENPLMSEMTDSDVKTALNAILTQLFPCLNRVFNVEFTGDPALEVGDYVRLHGGEIDTDRGYATGMITSQTWTFHGNHQIRCSMPSSLVYSGEETAAVMALADDTAVTASTTSPPERVQPKSQIQKRVDAIEAELKNSSGSASALTEYEYLTDLSAKCNGVTYTAEKDETTGLISKISDSVGNEFEPTITRGLSITDADWQNAVFMAVAMCRGLNTKSEITLFSGATGDWVFSGISGFRTIRGSWQASSDTGIQKHQIVDGYSALVITKSHSINNSQDGNTDTLVIRSNEKIDLTKYSKLRILAIVYHNYSPGLTVKAAFTIGEPTEPQQSVPYNFTDWKEIDTTSYFSNQYNNPGEFKWYDIGISDITGEQYLNFATYRSAENYQYSGCLAIKQIILVP